MTDFVGLNGSTWQLKELEQIPENDAVYTLNVRAQDMAGNPNSDADSVTFSLNRYGSVYVLGEETSVLLEQYYTNEAQELTLTEYNLSNQADSWIDVSRNSEEEKQLTKDTDYECTQQTIFDYNEHEEEHQRLNELVKKYLANDIEETDIEAEDRSVVKAMANASKKVEKMTKCRRETHVQRSQSEI